MKKTLAFLLAAASLACSKQVPPPVIEIIDKPISFSDARKQATLRYMKDHYRLNRDSIEITPRFIVIHWTAIDSLEASWKAFDHETLASGRPDVAKGGDLNVSAHYLIDRAGTIYRLMPDNWMARHVIGLNHCAIGIENVGGINGRDDLTGAQLAANIRLIRHLKWQYPKIQYLIGHHEYRKFEGHALWLETDSSYRTVKSDPGDKFMSRLGAEFSNLRF